MGRRRSVELADAGERLKGLGHPLVRDLVKEKMAINTQFERLWKLYARPRLLEVEGYLVIYSPACEAPLEHQLELRLGPRRFNYREQAVAPWLCEESP